MSEENGENLVVDQRGFVLTVSGSKVGRIENNRLFLWDKRRRREVELTEAELKRLLRQRESVGGANE